MTILVTGAGGLVGGALCHLAPDAVALDHAALDIADEAAVHAALDAHKPAVVINAAAMAEVDRADDDSARAFAVNGDAVGLLARACHTRGVRLVHLSTDYVLTSAHPTDRLSETLAPDPRSTYARSKRAGEVRALAVNAVVVRIQWVYWPGGRGFFTAALRRLHQRRPVRLVTDQIGCPSPARWVARGLLRCAAGGPTGLFHLATDGETTAQQWILEAANQLGLQTDSAQPATRSDFAGAWRPQRSCLDNHRFRKTWGLPATPWQDALHRALQTTGRDWLTQHPKR
jgi:dTDP-4-dehydrorhamnose reductase